MHPAAVGSRHGTIRDEILSRLRDRVVSLIHREALRVGERLPSIRELADDWGVHPRFVRAAYETLQREGIVALRPRSGVYVAAPPAGPEQADPLITDWLVGVLGQSRARGVSPVHFPEYLSHVLHGHALRAACVESNEDQIAWLAYELQADYGLDAFGVDLGAVDRAVLSERVRAADVVVSTAFHGELLESVARAEGKPIVLLRLAGNFVDLVLQVLSRELLYFVVGDRRFAERLPIIYGGVAGARNLRPLVAGEDDLGVIPHGAAVYVTRAAEVRVRESAALRTVLSPGRIFADSMAAELIRIIVRSNIDATLHRNAKGRGDSTYRDPSRRWSAPYTQRRQG